MAGGFHSVLYLKRHFQGRMFSSEANTSRVLATQVDNMAQPLNPASSILIIGAGTWGCSTALHLARRGYKNIKVLDPYTVPSQIAAGNDVNKIMEHRELKGTGVS